MEAIQTRYNNHFFRSRLEARWAVFFDQLGIKWLYEFEGFRLSNGSGYLPDFFLPEHNLYAEVKPIEQEDSRWELFAKESQSSFMLLFGMPHPLPSKTFIRHKEGVSEHPCVIVPKGWKYFPFYFACSQTDHYYADHPMYMKAVEEACSARF